MTTNTMMPSIETATANDFFDFLSNYSWYCRESGGSTALDEAVNNASRFASKRGIMIQFTKEGNFVMCSSKPTPKSTNHKTMSLNEQEKQAIGDVRIELHRALEKHPARFSSRHQAFGIIMEEVSKLNRGLLENNDEQFIHRLNSVAAMCVQTLIDWERIRYFENNPEVINELKISTITSEMRE